MTLRAAAFPLCLAALAQPVVAGVPDAAVRFVPKGWIGEAVATGDLNGDGRADTVLIVRQNDPARRITNDGLGASLLDTNPRRLLVLADKGGRLELAASSDTLIPPAGSEDNACLADPMEEGGIAIGRGALRVSMQNWLSCGSYGVTNRSYTLRLEGKRLRLIGYDRLDFSRSSGEGERLSVNYLTGRFSKTTGLVIVGDQPDRPKTVWRRFSSPPVHADGLSADECLEVEIDAGFC